MNETVKKSMMTHTEFLKSVHLKTKVILTKQKIDALKKEIEKLQDKDDSLRQIVDFRDSMNEYDPSEEPKPTYYVLSTLIALFLAATLFVIRKRSKS